MDGRMIYRRLGRTNIEIPVIGQGTTGAGPEELRSPERIRVREETLRLGIEHGMTLLDTGEHYDEGYAEQLVGRVARGMRDKVIISSKFRPDHNGFDDLLKAAEGSLRRLRTDYIDLYQVQWPNPAIPLAETIYGLMKLIEHGKIKGAGVCNFSPTQLAEAQRLSQGTISSVQTEYNLGNRIAETELIPYCERQGITVMAYSPFSQGRQAFSRAERALLEGLARKYDASVWQIILAWVTAHPSLIVITRSMNKEHILENAAAGRCRLAADDVDAIRTCFLKETVMLDPARINLLHTETPEPGWIYLSLEEALANRLNMKPGPAEIAEEIRRLGLLKPIEVKPTSDHSGRYDYDLLHGQMRYWGWIIAWGDGRPIAANILRGEPL